MIFVLLRLLAGLVRSRLSLVAENEMLRQQLVAAKCRLQGKRVRFSTTQRWLIGHLAITATAWRTAVALVQPTTVLRWHHAGFRLFFWRWRSRPAGLSSHAPLIREMATLNPRWGAERIRGELLKLGIHLSKRTVQRHMPRRVPGDGQKWSTCVKRRPAEVLLTKRSGSPEDTDLERNSLQGPRIKHLRDLFVIESGAQTRLRTLSVLTACEYRSGLTQQRICGSPRDVLAGTRLLRDVDE
jgi:hypothetical protein